MEDFSVPDIFCEPGFRYPDKICGLRVNKLLKTGEMTKLSVKAFCPGLTNAFISSSALRLTKQCLLSFLPSIEAIKAIQNKIISTRNKTKTALEGSITSTLEDRCYK